MKGTDQMRIIRRFEQTWFLLVIMVSLQVFWLAAKWLFTPAPNWGQLLFAFACTIIAGVVTGFMPTRFVFRLRQLGASLIQNEKLLLLILCTSVLIVGGVYANYGKGTPDEMGNFEAAKLVAEEGVASFFANYGEITWLGKQHPPLVPLIDGFAMQILGVNLLVPRLIALAFSMATILIAYSLGRELYGREIGLVGVLLLLSFPYLIRMGTLATNDIPTIFFFSLALFLALRLLRTPTYWLSAALGLSIGAGLLSKYTMVFIYVVLFGYLVVDGRFRRLKPHLGIAFLVSVGMLAAWLVYANHIGALGEQIDTISSSYIGIGVTESDGLRFLASWRMNFRLEHLLAKLPTAIGVYNLPMLFLGGKRLVQRRERSDLLILCWVVAVSLPLILILPDARYFMPAFPALAVVMALGLRCIPETTEQAVMLALLYCSEVLYLYAVMTTGTHLFFP